MNALSMTLLEWYLPGLPFIHHLQRSVDDGAESDNVEHVTLAS
jgi:hypothetical protein